MIMQMHHPRHPGILQPNINIHKKYNLLNVSRTDVINNMHYKKEETKKKKYHEHMRESKNKFKINNNNNPLSEDEMPLNNTMLITFIQGADLSGTNNSRFRFRSHQNKPIKVCHKVIYPRTVYKLVSNQICFKL